MADQQPSNIEPYIQPGNPITREPLEKKAANNLAENHSSTQGNPSVPSERHQDQGTFSSLGSGAQNGSGPLDAKEARNTSTSASGNEDRPQNPNVDAEQLATLSEGKVADAVQRKSGIQKAPGDSEVKYDDYASDLDRKKAEQAAARDEVKEARKAGFDVDGGSAGGNVRGGVQVD
ncbi:hypothetical protein J7T55_012951 [Diaporthe amygdali]|uniref:uncharacterized protein n=1 Tax=Phomopsis amygdali TaxID=1214568 RepID=UPI0022FEBCCA|nr:uncharacterized protein J7T55_012951 [Diaporthe amygdali]KAJ0118697.1 hypothetical protein J7T55_012951 [Diaporthe amygdali]